METQKTDAIAEVLRHGQDRRSIAIELVQLLAADDPAFDRERFMRIAAVA